MSDPVEPSESAAEPPDRPTTIGATHAGRHFPRRPAEPLFSRKLPDGSEFKPENQGMMPEFTTGAFDAKGYTEIDHGRWLGACAYGTAIGTCRRCGALMMPERPREYDGYFEYTAVCRRPFTAIYDPESRTRYVDGCGYEFVSPRGKLLIGSSMRSERLAAVSKRRRSVSDT
jgi:hypothetical protein